MSEPGVISIERMERPLKWLLVSFMGIVSLGCLCASVFAMHESALVCQSAASCEVVRRLVPGLDVGAHLPPLARASTQLSGNPRGTYASELVLEYATGETDVFDGVGPRGERAEEVAAQLNQAIHGGPWQPAYQLRERSLPIALVMLTLAVGALAFIAFFAFGMMGGWAWSWIFFLVPSALAAFMRGSGRDC